MKRVPAIIAALPREIAALVKGWERRSPARGVAVYSNGEAVVACAGMGVARVALAVQAAMDALPVTDLLSVGLAGACDPKLRVGELVRAGVVLDSRTGERFEDSPFSQLLVSSDAIASVREKARLHATCYAHAVDMEAASVARLARERGLGFHAIKVISDEADFELAELARFSTADGQFREGAFALHAALHPAMWSKVIALGRNSGKAVAALTVALRGELDWYRNLA
ncbi:MAG: phosphorylase [Acidobacteriaceae bacterium]|nr:phosphorylase [Acidobacteriaceae bacterium]